MYERLLNKNHIPTENEILEYIGTDSLKLLNKLENELQKYGNYKKELKFPYGNHYGWGINIR